MVLGVIGDRVPWSKSQAVLKCMSKLTVIGMGIPDRALLVRDDGLSVLPGSCPSLDRLPRFDRGYIT
ncbi:ketol-acid reductoisomerase [Roseibium sp. TrichSKD4]|nr:ketol-acid reductoisomerase [Roseibium sp. TrichSKD4]